MSGERSQQEVSTILRVERGRILLLLRVRAFKLFLFGCALRSCSVYATINEQDVEERLC